MSPKMLALSLAFSTLGPAALGSPALARAPEGAVRQTLRAAMEVPGLSVTAERVVFDARGRKDLVVFAKNRKGDVAAFLKEAYRTRTPLAGGVEVIGYAHLVASDSWTFTLALDEKHYVIEVDDDGRGSRLALWGRTFDRKRAPNVVPPARKLKDSRGAVVPS